MSLFLYLKCTPGKVDPEWTFFVPFERNTPNVPQMSLFCASSELFLCLKCISGKVYSKHASKVPPGTYTSWKGIPQVFLKQALILYLKINVPQMHLQWTRLEHLYTFHCSNCAKKSTFCAYFAPFLHLKNVPFLYLISIQDGSQHESFCLYRDLNLSHEGLSGTVP